MSCTLLIKFIYTWRMFQIFFSNENIENYIRKQKYSKRTLFPRFFDASILVHRNHNKRLFIFKTKIFQTNPVITRNKRFFDISISVHFNYHKRLFISKIKYFRKIPSSHKANDFLLLSNRLIRTSMTTINVYLFPKE